MAIFLSKYYGRIPLIILWQLIVGLSPAIQAREVAAPILTWADFFFKSKSKDCLCKPPPLPPLQQPEGQSLHPGAQTPIIQCCSINYVAIDVFKGNLSFKTLSYQTERAMKMFMMSNLCSGAWRSLSLSHCLERTEAKIQESHFPRYSETICGQEPRDTLYRLGLRYFETICGQRRHRLTQSMKLA